MTPSVSLSSVFQLGQLVADDSAAPLALDEVIDHAALDRAGTIERVEGGEIFDGGGLVAAQHIAHAAGLELEYSGGERAVKDLLVGLGIVERDQRHDRARCRCLRSMSLSASSITVSVVSPRKSILSRPSFSTAFMS